MAETRVDAENAFDFFLQAYSAKYPKAVECLVKDRDRLLTFYDFPAEHWRHVRTSNPIESTFASASQNHQDQGLPIPQHRAGDGLQAIVGCQVKMAQTQWLKASRRGHSGSDVQGRNQANPTRRLINPSPTFGDSSDHFSLHFVGQTGCLLACAVKSAKKAPTRPARLGRSSVPSTDTNHVTEIHDM